MNKHTYLALIIMAGGGCVHQPRAIRPTPMSQATVKEIQKVVDDMNEVSKGIVFYCPPR